MYNNALQFVICHQIALSRLQNYLFTIKIATNIHIFIQICFLFKKNIYFCKWFDTNIY